LPDDVDPEEQREKWRRALILFVGGLLTGFFVLAAIVLAPDKGAQGFQRDAELMKFCLTLAVAFASGAIVSFLVGEFGRAADDRRKKADDLRQQKSDDASERRRLVGELRDVHHAVTTAKLRIRAHRTVRTYGDEIREVVIPKVSQLGGVISDVKRHKGELIQRADADSILEQLGIIMRYLRALTREYEKCYLAASLVQEADYQWRQHRVKELVQGKEFKEEPPPEDRLPAQAQTDSSAWSYLKSCNEGKYRFPRLLIYLELRESEAVSNILSSKRPMRYTHRDRFSKPMRNAMDKIDQSKREVHPERSMGLE
jgi:hypothetical protein